ncbi:MAG: subtype A tannase [Anaerolineales bacterium]
MKQKQLSLFLLMVLILSMLTGCATAAPTTESATATSTDAPNPTATQETAVDPTKDDAYASALTFNNSAWNYDAENDVYWQIGVQYAATPAATEYETLGIYVPGAYMTATANGDGTYTATINEAGTINGFTAKTAPMMFPVNTPGYSAQQAPSAYSYDELSSYLKAGFIYIYAGMRGRDNGYDASGNLTYSGGAPWGVTDLKAAIRYVRYNKNILPGNTDSLFVFGMSGGGAQTSVVGASGDSKLYFPYLESIGAAMYDAEGQYISDAVTGAMAWCPITSLDYADAAYEWNMGQYSSTGTRAEGTFTAALSKDLAASYADYINALGIKDENGNVLTLEQSENGIYAAGSYYEYLVATVETSLNHFLADTTFPYTDSGNSFMAGGNLPGGGLPNGGTPPDGGMPGGGTPPAGGPAGNTSTSETAVTYQTVQEYIDALNKDGQWVTYDAATNTVKITSLAWFVNSQKNPSKSVGAFDNLDRSAAENNVFGNDENDNLHFDFVLADLLAANQTSYATFSDWDASYVDAYATDLKALDTVGNGIQYRQNMYNPMYYLSPSYEGYQASTPAKYWRIRTGIEQGDTATTVEMNLALALENYDSVESVDFATVWNQGHTMAERTGNSTDNFIAWVTEVTQK